MNSSSTWICNASYSHWHLLLFFHHHFHIDISHKQAVKCLLTTRHLNQKSNMAAQQQGVHDYRRLVHNAYIHFMQLVRFPGISMTKCEVRKSMACRFHYQPRKMKLESEQYLSFPPEQLNKFWVSLLLHCAFHRITLIINQQMHLHKISHKNT